LVSLCQANHGFYLLQKRTIARFERRLTRIGND
jgi:hypothetical protein